MTREVRSSIHMSSVSRCQFSSVAPCLTSAAIRRCRRSTTVFEGLCAARLQRKAPPGYKYRIPIGKQLPGPAGEHKEGCPFYTCLQLNRRAIHCFVCSLLRRQKSVFEVKPLSTAHAATFKTDHHEQQTNRSRCDVAFLAHPASLLSAFALWLPEDRPAERCGCLTVRQAYRIHMRLVPGNRFFSACHLNLFRSAPEFCRQTVRK